MGYVYDLDAAFTTYQQLASPNLVELFWVIENSYTSVKVLV